MIDPIDLLLCKDGADTFIDQLRRNPIVAQGLFEHDPRLRRDDAGCGEMVAGQREQIGRRGKKHDAHRIVTALEFRAQLGEIRRGGRIDLDIVDQVGKGAPASGAEFIRRHLLAAHRLDLRQIFATSQTGARHCEHPRPCTNLTGDMPAIQGRNELA